MLKFINDKSLSLIDYLANIGLSLINYNSLSAIEVYHE